MIEAPRPTFRSSLSPHFLFSLVCTEPLFQHHYGTRPVWFAQRHGSPQRNQVFGKLSCMWGCLREKKYPFQLSGSCFLHLLVGSDFSGYDFVHVNLPIPNASGSRRKFCWISMRIYSHSVQRSLRKFQDTELGSGLSLFRIRFPIVINIFPLLIFIQNPKIS